jgi:hypothetical protein
MDTDPVSETLLENLNTKDINNLWLNYGHG